MSELERATMETLTERRAALQRRFDELALELCGLIACKDFNCERPACVIRRELLALWERLK